MSEATDLRKIANDLRMEADRRDAAHKIESRRVVTAAVGIAMLRKLAGGFR